MQSPVAIFFKQTSSSKTYFADISKDAALRFGQVAVYTDSNWSDQIAGLHIILGPSYLRYSSFSRLWSWLKYFTGAARLIWSMPATALLFIVAQPPFLPLLGYLRNLWYGQKYAVWVDDIYPDVLTRTGRLSEGHPVVLIWRWLNRKMLGRAEFVSTLGPCMARVLGQYVADGMNRIMIIPTWADTNTIRPLPKKSNPFACKYGQVGKLTIQYSGNLGLTHDLDTMIQAAERLQNYHDICFMIIGSGSGWDKAVQSASRLGNITMLPWQPEDVMPYSLSTADVSVVTLIKGMEGISMPSKTYHAMASGTALLGISHRPSDLQAVIDRYECGINVEPSDVDGFVRAVVMFRDKDYLAKCRRNARQAAETEFSKPVNVRRVFDAIGPLINTQ